MLIVIIQTLYVVGLWFLVATGLQFAAVYAEQMGAARKEDDEQKRDPGFGAFALMVVTTLTPGLLFVHAFFLTHNAPPGVRIVAIGLVVAAVLVSAVAGRLVGLGWKSAAPVMRMLALPLGIAALVVAIYATRPSLEALLDLAEGRVITLPVEAVR